MQERYCAEPGCTNILDPRNRNGKCRKHSDKPTRGQFNKETARIARAIVKTKAR